MKVKSKGSLFVRRRSNKSSSKPPRVPGNKGAEQAAGVEEPPTPPTSMTSRSRSLKARLRLNKRHSDTILTKIDDIQDRKKSTATEETKPPGQSTGDNKSIDWSLLIHDAFEESVEVSPSAMSELSCLKDGKYVKLQDRLIQREEGFIKKSNDKAKNNNKKSKTATCGGGTNLLAEMDFLCKPIEKKYACTSGESVIESTTSLLKSYDTASLDHEFLQYEDTASAGMDKKKDDSFLALLLGDKVVCSSIKTFDNILTLGAGICVAPKDDNRTVGSDPIVNLNRAAFLQDYGHTADIVPAAHSWPLNKANQALDRMKFARKLNSCEEELKWTEAMLSNESKQNTALNAQIARLKQGKIGKSGKATMETSNALAVEEALLAKKQEWKKREDQLESQCVALKSQVVLYRAELAEARNEAAAADDTVPIPVDELAALRLACQDASSLKAEIAGLKKKNGASTRRQEARDEAVKCAKEQAEVKNIVLAEGLEKLEEKILVERTQSQKTIDAQNDRLEKFAAVMENLKADVEQERVLKDSVLKQKEVVETTLQEKIDVLSREIETAHKRYAAKVSVAQAVSEEGTLNSDVEFELEGGETITTLNTSPRHKSPKSVMRKGWFRKMVPGKGRDDDTLSINDHSQASFSTAGGKGMTSFLNRMTSNGSTSGRVSFASEEISIINQNSTEDASDEENTYLSAVNDVSNDEDDTAADDDTADDTFATSDKSSKANSSDSETDCTSSSETDTYTEADSTLITKDTETTSITKETEGTRGGNSWFSCGLNTNQIVVM